jgi:hypothetical protein
LKGIDGKRRLVFTHAGVERVTALRTMNRPPFAPPADGEHDLTDPEMATDERFDLAGHPDGLFTAGREARAASAPVLTQ